MQLKITDLTSFLNNEGQLRDSLNKLKYLVSTAQAIPLSKKYLIRLNIS